VSVITDLDTLAAVQEREIVDLAVVSYFDNFRLGDLGVLVNDRVFA